MRVAICGGGVIGACLAYFLSLKGADVLLVERHRVAGGASGKSGGFLAFDWCDGSALAPLARRSFALHAELAEAFGNPWGYRRLDSWSAAASAGTRDGRRLQRARSGSSPAWLDEGVLTRGQIGTPATTAQITPDAFTLGMLEQALALGAERVIGEVTGVALAPDGTAVQGVEIDGRSREAGAVVIAMGPWSARARSWLPVPEVYGLKGHSILLRPKMPVPADALFVDIVEPDGLLDTPEVFPRPDGSVYLCGLSSEDPLPPDPAAVATDRAATARLKRMAALLSPALAEAELLAAHACYRPVTRDGLPLMGPVPGIEGAYLATGHSVWGMLNAPATGEAMAGLILGGRSDQVDLAAFDPARFF
ncbi:MAG: FAD-binding oxidoreductase [Alphaproteobacteria bacterium]